MAAISTIYNTLVNTPLPLMIEKLGLAVADAQAALDRNSINMLKELADTPVRIRDNDYNLLTLGFVPTFYAFTEATVEAKLDFSMTEATSFEIGGSVKVDYKAVAVAVNANYARKFEQSASGSSSIAARLVSLPPPETFLQILKENARTDIVKVTSVTISGASEVASGGSTQLTATVLPANAANKAVTWSFTGTDVLSITDGLFVAKPNTTASDINATVTATSVSDPAIKGTKVIKIKKV
jgi:Bacterial Ig-like domain (group 2)